MKDVSDQQVAEHLKRLNPWWQSATMDEATLGLRPRAQLLEWIAAGGLRVLERHDVRPVHAKATAAGDALQAARAAEITSLWRLAAA